MGESITDHAVKRGEIRLAEEAFKDLSILVDQIRGRRHLNIEKFASFKFRVGNVGGSRAGVSPAQRTLEAP
ncbi:hypothetical protein [Paraburkholderia fungorum]|uniref:hypothetical protein n=1 Tax=Paraburkholderia fungorum TaxID=134537 RepID=UPI00209791BF|nr:hypothetical protein [Paraburkholderia fungorum]